MPPSIVLLCALFPLVPALQLAGRTYVDETSVDETLPGGHSSVGPSVDETLKDAGVEQDAVCAINTETTEIIVHSLTGETTQLHDIKHPVLCQVTSNKDGKLPTHNPKKFALMGVYSSDAYIRANYSYWTLVNKLAYSERTHRPYFIWVGDLGDKFMCGASNHYYKPLAEAAILNNKNIPGLMHLDADAWVSHRNTDEIERFLDLAPDADVFFTQGRTKHKVVFANSGINIIKNTPFGHQLLKRWWGRRCGSVGGDKDQPGLWYSMFKILRERSGGKFNFRKFDSAGSYTYVLSHFRKEYRSLGQQGPWNCPWDKCWNDRDRLILPIQLDKIVILPAQATKLMDGSTIQGMHQDITSAKATTFCCHLEHRRARKPREKHVPHKRDEHHTALDEVWNGCEPRKICSDGACGPAFQSKYGSNPDSLKGFSFFL